MEPDSLSFLALITKRQSHSLFGGHSKFQVIQKADKHSIVRKYTVNSSILIHLTREGSLGKQRTCQCLGNRNQWNKVIWSKL